MAFPQIAALNGGGDTTNQNDHTVNLPTGIASGNLLIVIFTCDQTAATLTWPAGWTNLYGPTPSGTIVQQEARYRIADGSEGSTITVSTSTTEMTSHISMRITGWHGTTPPEAATATGTSANPNPPSLNPAAWNIEDTLWIAVCGHDDGTRTVSAYPYASNNRNDRGNNAQSTGTGVASTESAAASVDPGTFTISTSDDWVAATIAVRPAATGTFTLTADKGTFTLTGVAAGLKSDRRLQAAKGTFALTGVAAGLRAGRKLVAAKGTFILAGQAATLRKGFKIVASAGSFTLTGVAANLSRTRKLVAGTGVFTLTGQAANLVYTAIASIFGGHAPVDAPDPDAKFGDLRSYTGLLSFAGKPKTDGADPTVKGAVRTLPGQFD